MKLKIVLQAIRPAFLVLTPICIFLGLSTSLSTVASINYFLFFIVLVGAICAHISVNTLNEYYDFKSGLDFKTEKTPFSGGSGALPGSPGVAKTILVVGILSLIATIAIGFYLIWECGLQIMPIGIIGVATIVTYTQWLNRMPLLCLVAPGLGFGVLMVVGTHVILTGGHSLLPWLVSLIPFFLINNLLLLNQYPDIKADTSVGRNTFPIAFGLNKSNFVYAVFMMTAYLLIPVLIINDHIPVMSIFALIPVVFSLLALVGAIKYTSKIGEYPQYMGANVAATILAPLLLGISIING